MDLLDVGGKVLVEVELSLIAETWCLEKAGSGLEEEGKLLGLRWWLSMLESMGSDDA